MHTKKIIFLLILIISIFSFNTILNSPNLSAKNFQDNNIIISHQQIKQGSVLKISADDNSNLTNVIFNEIKYHPNKDDINKNYQIFIPISYWLKPGNYDLKIIGENLNINENIEVLSGNFTESHITFKINKKENTDSQNDKTENKQDNTAERKKRETQMIIDARKKSSKEKLWEGKFIWPVEGHISSPFGATRYVNGNLHNRHSGTDIAAPTGTDVKATASGIVTLAAELLSTGNTIIIDHGWNIYSSYSHLDSLNVKKGQSINKGDLIGKVGSTGFSTGPHLHWTIKVNNVFVKPEQFIINEF
ncbi:MAG: M23 family metallopeptidase [Bacillota bacterium]